MQTGVGVMAVNRDAFATSLDFQAVGNTHGPFLSSLQSRPVLVFTRKLLSRELRQCGIVERRKVQIRIIAATVRAECRLGVVLDQILLTTLLTTSPVTDSRSTSSSVSCRLASDNLGLLSVRHTNTSTSVSDRKCIRPTAVRTDPWGRSAITRHELDFVGLCPAVSAVPPSFSHVVCWHLFLHFRTSQLSEDAAGTPPA